MADAASEQTTSQVPEPKATGYSWYVLSVLVLVYILNFIDRQIVNILQEDIKHELGLNDTQLGMMTGLTFAVVYCTMGIPVARIELVGAHRAHAADHLAVLVLVDHEGLEGIHAEVSCRCGGQPGGCVDS